MSSHNTNDIVTDLKRVFDEAQRKLHDTLWRAYDKAISDAYKLGFESGVAVSKNYDECPNCGHCEVEN